MKPGLKRQTSSPTILYKYRPLVELLEDRYAPGSLLNLSGEFLAGAALGLPAKLGESSNASKPVKAASGESLNSKLLQAVQPKQKLPAIVPTGSAKSGGGSSTVSNVFARSSDTALVNTFGALSFPEAAKAGLAPIGSTGGGSAGVTGELPSGGSANKSGGSSEMVQMGSTFTVGTTNAGASGARFFDTQGLGSLPDHDHDHDLGYYDARTGSLGSGANVPLDPFQNAIIAGLKQQMPYVQIAIDNANGVPSTMYNGAGFLTNIPTAASTKDIVVNFIGANKDLFKLTDADIGVIGVSHEYSLGQDFKNQRYIYLEQQPFGIPVYQDTTPASVTADGRLIMLSNRLVPNLLGSITTTSPVLTPADAVARAATHFGMGLSTQFQVGESTGPERDTTVTDPAISDQPITVQLRYLNVQLNETRLMWNLTLALPQSPDLVDINVDAVTGQVWTVNNLAKNDSYRVLKLPIDSPPNGSFTVVNNPADPVANGVGSIPFPGGVPTWHNTDGDPEPERFDTFGNNAVVQDDIDGNNAGGLRPTGGAGNNYNFPANFNREPYTPPGPGIPADVSNIFAGVTQAFYTVNVTHDILYHYGFTESAGNFQLFNFGRGGRQGDPVVVDVQDPSPGGPSMATPIDGGFPTLTLTNNFGITTPERDFAFSADVIIHEYAHGLSSRLVGGPFSGGDFGGDGSQSGGMGEGWSDYFGIAFTQKASHTSTTNRTSGNWILGQGQNGFGVRRLPYTTDMSVNPLTYNDIDDTQVDVLFPFNPPVDPRQAPPSEVHNSGEIWASVLWDMHWRLINRYGFSTDFYNGNGGNNIALKLVTEGMRLTPSAATMLEARNGILAADIALYGGANQLAIWTAFARRGMGQFANSVNGDSTLSVREDFTVPPIPGQPGGGGGGGGGAYPGSGGNDGQYEPNEFSNQAFNLGGHAGVKQYPGLAIKDRAQQDRDWFRFKTKNNGSTTVQIDMGNNAGDLDLILYRKTSSGTLQEVDRSTDRGDGGSESVTFNAQGGVQYLFQVIGFNGDTGNYGITITAP